MFLIEYLPHTADIRMRISADSKRELLRAGLNGINQILAPEVCNDAESGEMLEKRVSMRSVDGTSLVIDFLSDVLTHSQAEKAVFCDLNIHSLTDTSLDASIIGRKVDFFEEDIKAVTYHEAEVALNAKGLWETLVVFDI